MFLWHLIALSVFHISLYRISDAKKVNWTSERKLEYREATRELWEHGYESYMSYAFPMDELMPLSCFGRGPDWDNPSNIGTNDVAGNYSLTLVDILDTLAIMGNQQEFSDAVENVINWVQFDVDTKPQVFEVTIRVLGGLLSGHILASEERLGHKLDWYQGQLLALAKDLGERLLPAFKTDTGLPYARINLRHGVLANESTETCVAGAGSLILEFGTLSRLTGDDRFEKAAYKAFFGLWNRRSDIGLVGNNIDVHTGKWGTETTGIGAGVDSFYEYALKW
ncbi:alpha mannosidase-like protein [Serendipita sp. 397]|nr:alpha mannosidase-like protein [Serendipita sp. 397]